ncbi:MAG: hypothetical protein WBP61_02785 [Nocardioides sp.]
MAGTPATYADVMLRLPPAMERWQGPAFRDELREWIAGAVGEPTSLEPAKMRPWATVWRVETGSGVFYAKQNCSTQSFEASVVLALNDLAARHVVPLAAVDAGRGLFLTPDLGDPLGDCGVDGWCRVAVAGAQLQLEVARYPDRLIDAGLTRLSSEDCVAYVEQRLESFAALPSGDPRGLSAEQRERVVAVLPDVARWSEQVGGLGLPLTLCHNDLHGHNVFDVGGELRFFDFADALLMEPLAALLIPLNVLAHQLDAAPDDPRLLRVADAALEVWTDYAPLPALRAALPAALQLARLGRVEAWVRCTAPMGDAELTEWGDAAAYWLASLGEPPPAHPA